MGIVRAAFAGLVGAALGWIAITAAAIVFGDVTGQSNAEGAFAMFAVFGLGPIGGLTGLALGLWLALRRRPTGGLGGVLWRTIAALAIITVMVGGALAYLYETRPLLGDGAGRTPRLDFEIRFAPGFTLPAPIGSIDINLNTDKNRIPARLATSGAITRDARLVLQGSVDLHHYATWRLLDVALAAGQPVQVFDLKLPARPRHMSDFGPWRPVDMTAEGDQQPKRVTGAPIAELRSRVVYPD